MKDNHTPGPWEAGHEILRGDGALIGQLSGIETDLKTDSANARLCAAAVNSYDKHCGDRAVECAEGDLLGECLKVLEALDLFTFEVDKGLNKIENLSHIVSAAIKVLAKTKGE